MHSSPQAEERPAGSKRRWLVWLAVLVVLLAAWAVALLWFTGQVTDGVEQTLNFAPAVEDTRHRAD